MIATQPEFSEFLDSLKAVPRLALDTEADSLHCYFEKLCLIQIALPGGKCLLVDPLVPLPLQPFFDVLRDKAVVFHGGDYDLRLLGRSGDFVPTEIFDTTIAARLIGGAELGLAALVKKYFDVTLCKESQRANWGVRPLPERMLEYAMNDVRYLLELADILSVELHRLGRWDWFTESVERMVASSREVREKDADRQWRVSGSAALEPREQAVVRELWQWRDEEAREWNRPAFHVMGNEDLLRVATAGVAGRPLPKLKLIPVRYQRMLRALERALALPESQWPVMVRGRRKRVTREQQMRYEKYRTRRDEVAKELQLDPAIIAPRAALEMTAEDPQGNFLMRWQRTLLEIDHEPSLKF